MDTDSYEIWALRQQAKEWDFVQTREIFRLCKLFRTHKMAAGM
jgi:hypothetical protein